MGGGKADLPGRSPSFARAKAGALAVACPERPREAGESKGAIPAFGRWRWSFGIRRKNKRDKNTKKDCFREEVPEKPKKMFPEEWFCRKSSSAYNAVKGAFLLSLRVILSDEEHPHHRFSRCACFSE